jgi:transposase
MHDLLLLREHELQRLSVIKRALSDLSATGAATMLRLSPRQVFRLKAKVREQGTRGIIHGNTGRRPAIAKPQAIHHRVLTLYRQEFYDYDITHFVEALAEECHVPVSYDTVRRWLRAANLGPHQHRLHVHHRLRRERRPRFGEWLFLDGSPHHWFGPDRPQSTLILATDDATGKPLYGLFAPQETLNACFQVLYHVSLQYGLPGALYLDHASQFTTTRHGGTHRFQRDDKPTHFEIAMQTLAIQLIFADSPQARGRGERINGTFQRRLVPELRRAGITEPEPATAFLNDKFIPGITRRFGVVPKDPRSAFRKPPSHLDLRTVLCAKTPRTVSGDNTISYGSQTYQLLPTRYNVSLVGGHVQVQEWFDGSIHVFHPSRKDEVRIRRVPARPAQGMT